MFYVPSSKEKCKLYSKSIIYIKTSKKASRLAHSVERHKTVAQNLRQIQSLAHRRRCDVSRRHQLVDGLVDRGRQVGRHHRRSTSGRIAARGRKAARGGREGRLGHGQHAGQRVAGHVVVVGHDWVQNWVVLRQPGFGGTRICWIWQFWGPATAQ